MRIRFEIFFLLIGLNLVTGCANHRPNLEPISREQKAFYRVRALHEKGESRETLEAAERFLKRYPSGILSMPVKYYAAVNQQRIGNLELAKQLFREIAETRPESGWTELAESNLKSMGD
ncbi:MAG: hypothetical protein A2036_04460 [Omnitrophica bacterium GWA2_50_21]|nr:MAG: hypothetical protein A2036_04460 [Omnitrophica bacterium GWA2_50_21]